MAQPQQRLSAHQRLARSLLERSLRSGRSVRLTVEGGCMDPLLRSGDRALVNPSSRPRTGDVVLARGGDGAFVCHRILRRDGEGLLLAGDRSAAPELRPPWALVGRVDEVRGRGGVRRLDRRRDRLAHRLNAALHLVSWRARPHPAGRWIDALRRRLLGVTVRIHRR